MKSIVKKIFNSAGIDVVRLQNSPKYTLLGLRHLPVRSIIDVGANIGNFSKMMASLYPDAKIFCFEPLPDPFRQLNAWAMSQHGNVKTFNLALGDSEGEIEINCHVDHPPSSSLLMTTERITTVYSFVRRQVPVPVKMETLDKLLSDFPEALSPEIIIKLDVQGYEDRVVRGGVDTFRKARACILEINLDNLYCGQADFRNLVNQLHELGFRYGGNLEQTYADDGRVVYINTVFVKNEVQGGI